MTTGPYQVMPDLSVEELNALAASITEHGVLVAVVIDEEGAVIDGHHRQLIADSLGIDYPIEMREGLTEVEKRTLAFDLNGHRRHLSPEVKRALISRSLKADPDLSDRQHAARVGCDHKTVGTVRGSLERRGEIPKVEQRKDSTGRQQPASKAESTRSETRRGEVPHVSEGSSSAAPEFPDTVEPDDDAAPNAGDSDTGAAPEGSDGSATADPSENDQPPAQDSPELLRAKAVKRHGDLMKQARHGLLMLSPIDVAAHCPAEDRDDWLAFAGQLADFAERLATEFAPQPLRSVQ